MYNSSSWIPYRLFQENMIETNSDSKKVMLFLKKMQDLENNQRFSWLFTEKQKRIRN
jgi:hypothetical protein